MSARGKREIKSGRPSDRVNQKTVDPFGKGHAKTKFTAVYVRGDIPCKLVHGSVKHKLQWNIDVDDVQFDPVLIIMVEGLRETLHPYTFIAREGIKELLETQYVEQKLLPVLDKIIPGLRAALIDKDDSVCAAALEAVSQISRAAGPHMNIHLKQLVQTISRKVYDKNLGGNVMDTLKDLEMNGGKDAGAIIKSKVPTFSTAPPPLS